MKHVRELEVERLLLREPGGGRIRAILECGPPRPPGTGAPVPAVRLSFLGPDGKVALVLEVDDAGEPAVYVGNPDRGATVAISRRALDLWAGGNIVATLRASEEGGRLELIDGTGRAAVALPEV